ncbi:alpha/beta fold hydrolase [Jiangella alkaliphila]|uniref:Lysophospholipase, alpha-beta hydrolase superfamily n=1 Tax=Jiangella alkaliphila TaxID=419479 RepID=A0A1H2L9P4_9ACTN|nr:alpha/beta hydrolase [Jiangella alkaliphila]SDU77723.1 Lysophospholipase, alpha-beta hydrolase superfamily [Jiangella alkaliphila]
MQARSADGTPIAVTRTGDGPALVVVDPAGAFHGLRPVAGAIPALARRFAVHTYDRRGRGDSGDTAPFAPDRETDDLAAVIALAGGEADVYGFSSGAAVALRGAAAGLPIRRVALLEPPFVVGQPADEEFDARLRELIGRGEHAAAVEFFNRAIGVPDEWIEQLRAHPAWPGIVALAPTLLYDAELTATMTAELLAAVETPVLVLGSGGSDDYLRGAARDVASRLPAGEHRELPGDWHGVDDAVLAAQLTGWFA